jgi:ABC-type lipoprotein release transport system permease subunit
MTPQEIFDYKNSWLPGYEVKVHSDLRDHAKDWCKTNLEKHQYHIKTWTNIYQYSYYFEDLDQAAKFYAEFESWVLNK